MMDHGMFILAAYLVTVASVGGLLVVSWTRMRRAERAIEEERR